MISQYKAYLLFCTHFLLVAFPASAVNLALFAQFLSRSFKSFASVQNYISGIRTWHTVLGFQPPDISEPVLKLCLQGLRRLMPATCHRAYPITPQMLNQMAKFVDRGTPYSVACWSAMLIGFFSFARRSNLVPASSKSFNPGQQLVRADIIKGEDRLVVLFKWSKTNQYNSRIVAVPILALPGTSICPVTAYSDLIRASPASSGHPCFSYWNKRSKKLDCISRNDLQDYLRSLVSRIGLDPSKFSCHSLRRGGATSANTAGCSSMQIKSFGDWKSDCFQLYVEADLDSRTRTAEQFSKLIAAELKIRK